MIFPSITGTIYSIEKSIRKNKTDPSIEYDVWTITLEVRGGKKIEFPQLEAFAQDLSMYAKHDNVIIDYELCGFRLKKEDGTEKIINRTSIRDIKYADIVSSKKHVKQVDASKVDYKKLMVEVDQPDIVEDDSGDQLPF